jgi:hypothetical protein
MRTWKILEPLLGKKELLENSKEMQETDTLLAKLEALEWLQGANSSSYS